MITLHHKKNELQEVEFYQDKECTIPFDFTNAKDLYVQGGIATLIELSAIVEDCNIYIPFLQKTKYYTLSAISFVLSENRNILYILSETDKFIDGTFYNSILENIKTLSDITPNLSKYIPEDNAVLFLSEESFFNYEKCFKGLDLVASLEKLNTGIVSYKKITIFLPHGTQAELQKANEVAKELKEKYGVGEVNLFVLHNFHHNGITYNDNTMYLDGIKTNVFWNKIITTNSTGILPVRDTERLQVIDCKEIFEEYLKA